MNFRKILGFALGPIATASLGLISIPMMAWYFSPEDMGRMNILNITLSFCLLFSVLGLDQAYVREYHGNIDTNRLFKACFVPGFILLLIFTFVSIPFHKELTRLIFNLEDASIFALTVICVYLNYISRFQSLILRMQERGLAYSMSQLIPKLLQLLLLGIVVWSGTDPHFSVLMLIISGSMITVVVIYLWNTRKETVLAFKANICNAELRILFRFGFPLIFSGISYWALAGTSTIVLRSHSSLSELGIYSVISSIAGVAAIFQSVFTVVWSPTVYKWVHQGVDMARIDIIAQQALALVCLFLAAVGAFAWITDYMLPSHYSNIKYLLPLAIAPPMLYTLSEITGVGIAISRRTTLTIWITISALASNILISIWLIPIYGAKGAVVSNAMAYFVFFTLRTELSAKVWRQSPRIKIYFYLIVAMFLQILIAFWGDQIIVPPFLVWLFFLVLFIGGHSKYINAEFWRIKSLLKSNEL